MNKAQNRPTLHKVLSMILALVMVLSLLPLSGFTTAKLQAADTSVLENRIVHLDCGRKYFSVENIKMLIDGMYSAGYNQLQLAFGNSGLRFLLDDMSLSFDVNGNTVTYDSDTMVNNIKAGNSKQNSSGDESYLSQADMDKIISYAESKNIEIVPLLNMPGHMNAVLDAFEFYRIEGYKKGKSTISKSSSTLDLTNDEARAFGLALLQKYVNYFKEKSSVKHFNFGADEVGNDIVNPFYSFNEGYDKCISYINACAGIINDAGMTPRAFNDYMYYNNSTSEFNKNIEVCYWNNQWSNSPYASASTIADKGHKLINTNSEWYYVLGKTSSGSDAVDNNLSYALSNVESLNYNQYHVQGSDFPTAATAGVMLCIWCDSPNASTPYQAVSDGITLMKAFAEKNASVFPTSTGEVEPTPSAEPEAITVPVNGTATANVAGTILKEGTTYYVGDGTYATYTVKHNEAGTGEPEQVSSIESGKEYLIGDGTNWLSLNSSNKLSNEKDSSVATKWTITGDSSSGYTIQSGSYYLTYGSSSGGGDSRTYSLSAKTSSTTWTYDSNGSFSIIPTMSQYYLTYSSGWKLVKQSGTGRLYTEGSATEPTTTITFNGVTVTPEDSPAEVTIDNVKYKVTVTAEDLSNKTLPINIWITNAGVLPTGWEDGNPTNFSAVNDGSHASTRRSIYTLQASDDGVYSQNGIELSSILPTVNGEKSGTASCWNGSDYNVVYWKNSYNTAAQRQSTDGWTNFSHQGTDFEYIRYWDSTWAYSVDGKEWTPIDNIGAAKTDTAKNQVNIWYRQVTEVTTEVTTLMVDWGPISYASNQCLLDFAVQYESGERTPTSFPKSGKTIGFDCQTSDDAINNGYVTKDGSYYYRTVYGIAGIETADYEVYMITVTPSSDSKSTYISKGTTPSSYSYSGTEKIAWAETEADAENSKLTTTTDVTYGGEPFLEKVNIYQYQGLLVTYYVRAKVTEDSLTVNYFKTTNKDTAQEAHEQIYTYNIAVKTGTYFDGICLPETEIDNKSCLTNGRIKNKQDVYQYVSSNLTTMPAVSAQYRYSDYDCYKVEVSDDNKTVNIYYTFNNDKVFVVDFGLPVVLKPSDFNASLAGDDVTIESVNISAKTNYAKISVDESTHNITYTLTEAINGEDTFSVEFSGTIPNETGTQSGSIAYTVTIIPASTVYYEDGFARFTSGKYTADSSAKEVAWELLYDNVAQNGTTQALEELGKKQNVYGYDDAYSSSTLYSLGSAHKVTVSADMANASDIVWPSATFTFKGTGFDIISLTDSDTGTILYTVTNKDTGEKVCSHILNTYYGYTYEDGEWKVDADATGRMYQVPVIKISGLEYANYEVEISVRYGKYFDSTGDDSYSFWLDGIRVYDPMGKNANYDVDGETSPSYVEIRKLILDAEALVTEGAKTGAVFIDGKGSDVTAKDYANYGPNHEAYLAKSQAIAFQLVASAEPTSVQLGAKLANGTAGALTITGASCNKATNGVLSLNTSTDMYYALTNLNWTAQDNGTYISNVITLTNNSSTDSIISLTNLKFIGATYTSAIPDVENAANEAALISLAASPAMVNEAVLAVSSVLAAEPTPDPEPSTEPDPEPSTEPEPDPEPEVKTFEPETFKVSLSKDSIRKGQEATLTVKASVEVTAITVNGTTYEDYQTRFERSGWKWWSADRTEYHVFTVTQTPDETTDYEVIAVNAEGAVSEAETVTLTVKAAQSNWWGDMWNSFFGKWF